MSNAPFFSVIVPSHNGAGHIRKGLSSILEQSFTDYELIVVCDTCTDATEKIAREYGADVYRADCMRDGLARNIGIEHAKGQWILFMDDDDWFLHEHVFKMLSEVLGKCGEDVLNFSFIWKGIGYTQQTFDSMKTMVWCRCYKAELIKPLRMNDKEYGADNDFFRDVVTRSRKMVWWNTPMYYYNYMREGSITERKENGKEYE